MAYRGTSSLRTADGSAVGRDDVAEKVGDGADEAHEDEDLSGLQTEVRHVGGPDLLGVHQRWWFALKVKKVLAPLSPLIHLERSIISCQNVVYREKYRGHGIEAPVLQRF